MDRKAMYAAIVADVMTAVSCSRAGLSHPRIIDKSVWRAKELNDNNWYASFFPPLPKAIEAERYREFLAEVERSLPEGYVYKEYGPDRTSSYRGGYGD